MGLLQELDQKDLERVGQEMHSLAAELYPICRSITGDGVRRTLAALQDRIRLEMCEVRTGTQVFDWTVPQEWNIRDAYIKVPSGERIVDYRQCNLHVVSYSTPVDAVMSLSELRPHLFTIPEYPDWTPYRTSYYERNWGFCLPHNQAYRLPEGRYEVRIDSTLQDGHMTFGECCIRGRSTDEILVSCHVCHPALANDNLSGITVATFLAQFLSQYQLHYSYRFLFAPATIGAITWLARNRETAGRICHGLVLTCLGDSGGFHYKKSRRGNATIDRAVAQVLRHCGEPAEVLEFSPSGYDERQYCSPGFNLPVGCLMRSVWGTFPEYHSSADNLEFISARQLRRSLRVCAATLDVLESNRRYHSLNPFCEPQLGRRNLYRSSGQHSTAAENSARLWVLNLSDGDHSLLDIAERSGIPFQTISEAGNLLCQHGLLAAMPESSEA